MADPYDHLGPSAREVIDRPAAERIARMRSRGFTDYPHCRYVLDLMAERIERPKGSLKPNLLIWGESGQGKSTIFRKHLRDHPAVFDRPAGVRRTPVVGIEMPPMCDVKWFYTLLLRAIDAPPETGRSQIPLMAERIVDLYRIIGVRQIAIDEAHNMLMGTVRQQRIMLAVIRNLTNILEVPLVLFGIQDAREALMHDRQLARRFHFIELPAWGMGEEFSALVGSVLRSLPLRRPSLLTARALKMLASHSQGVTANVFETLIELGVCAIQSEEERITAKDIIEHLQLPAVA
ncbi:TniB family NTP-binding protein [Azospirillum sp. TSO5]|uniref:TniB family NTP-binding protein n=1 Tax=Azospirillum sp. TSO5 TaxID=716760 RepID=UPI000D617890|nr:TniB family NTP-binding protein [Azospirillum sp. TSO5]PWC91537.1 hypothetical protein TSO5_19515 [Azospirillum sp. TSO5]